MTKKGRLLEQTVEAIEMLLSDEDVDIKSPGFIADLDSGNPREVDIQISRRIGSVRVFGFVECRDRRGKQDVRWIEEIASKLRSVGADFAVAVSRDGFTNGAITKADALGVRLRSVEDLDRQEVGEWFDCGDIRWVKEAFEVHGITLSLRGEVEPVPVDLAATRMSDPIVRLVESSEELTLSRFFDSIGKSFSGRLDLGSMLERGEIPESLALGEIWKSAPYPIRTSIPPEPAIETLEGVPIETVELQLGHIICVHRMTLTSLSAVVEVPGSGDKKPLGAVGLYEQVLPGGRSLKIWMQSDGKEAQQLRVSLDELDSAGD